ncbi:hypothetical protein PAMP_012482 [Pampus punctatissimus]
MTQEQTVSLAVSYCNTVSKVEARQMDMRMGSWLPCAMMTTLGLRSGSCGKKAVVSTHGMTEVKMWHRDV